VNKSLQITASIVLYRNDRDQVLAAARSFTGSSLQTELMLVDNSPTDELRSVAVEVGAEYLFAGRNLGFGAAHNLALQKYIPVSEYHLVLNPDVSFDPAILASLYDFMQGNRGVGMVMPRILYPDGSEQHLCKLLPTPMDLIARRFGGRIGDRLFRGRMDRYHLRDVDLTSPQIVPSLSGCFMMVRTEVLQRIGMFDERYFMYLEDVDLCRRIGAVSATAFYPEVAITHEYAKGSYSNKRLLQYHVASACRYFSKWGWLRDSERDRLNARVRDPRESEFISVS
jgi:GT2 family glycosyltransferase